MTTKESIFPVGSMAYEADMKAKESPRPKSNEPSYPFPPRTSAYWASPTPGGFGNSYDAAVANYNKKLATNTNTSTTQVHTVVSGDTLSRIATENGMSAETETETETETQTRTLQEFYYSELLVHEGGFVDDPDDLGGATNKGITYRTLTSHSQKVLGLPPSKELLKSLTDKQAYLIYKAQYWDKLNGDQITDPELAFQVFDFYVNAGNNAIKELQKCLNNEFGYELVVDGYWGGITLNALNKTKASDLYKKYREYRKAYYNRISNYGNNKKFLNGWLNRANSFNYY